MDQAYVDQAYIDQPPAELTCPTCGTVNPGTRRYCGHCGYSFVAAYGTDPYVDWSAWTPQAMAARDREAAREYRRSLPPLYRWRRVIIGALVFVLFVGFGAVLQLGPVALAQDGWHRMAKQYVVVSGVQVMVNPTTASAPDSNPQALVDSSQQEWTMTWSPTGSSAACGAAPGTGTLIFTFPATRVRQVVVWSGLDAGNPQRALQPQPQVIGIGFPDGSCQSADPEPDDRSAAHPGRQRGSRDPAAPRHRLDLPDDAGDEAADQPDRGLPPGVPPLTRPTDRPR